MLQPRLKAVGSVSDKSGRKMGFSKDNGWNTRCFVHLACIVILFNTQLALCQDVNINNEESIEATRIKRDSIPVNRDLTVLLVNDQKKLGDVNSKNGRYHSVKPLIGLLKSTARTFIQDGVTTEFATQILGTTLNNGRIYAQILTKSSLILYNKPSKVGDPVVVKPTRIHSDFDGQWVVKQDLGFIDPDNFVLKNSDYLAPNNQMEIVYASVPPSEAFKSWDSASSPESPIENQIFDEPTGRRIQPVNEIPRYKQNEAFNYLDGPSVDSEKSVDFVIKPSILKNVNTLHRQSKAFEVSQDNVKLDNRFKEDISESEIVKVKPNNNLPTFTIKNEFSPIFYYIDNVESRKLSPQAVTPTKLPKKLFGQKSEPRPKTTFTYAGFADFTTIVGDTVIIFTPNTETIKSDSGVQIDVKPSAKRVDNLASKITFLSADIPVATSTFKPYEMKKASKVVIPSANDDNEETTDKHVNKNIYNVENKVPDSINIRYNSGFDLNLDVIQPSEPVLSMNVLTKLTDIESMPNQDYRSKPTDPLNTIKPSSPIVDSQESIVSESIDDEFDIDTENYNEEMEDITESNESTTVEQETVSEESTENKDEDISNESDVIPDKIVGASDESCSHGLETLSTLTTAYKTLTYLTTYFIPVKSTETTTSIKSDVVVESHIGYLSNVVCRSNLDIKPTAILKDIVKPTLISSLEQEEKYIKENNTLSNKEEILQDVIPLKEESPLKNITHETTVLNQEDEVTQKSLADDNEDEVTTLSTTTEHSITSSESHIEASVATEEDADIVTDKQITTQDDKEDVESNENEIDLIYKTLYTTYTYFTTFFGDKASSVASHKSVVTNVITSSINLSNMDPSLLNVFNEDEIAPTNVGIGRPTESYAINSIIDLVKNKDVIESVEFGDVYSSQVPTPSLSDDIVASIKPDVVKTFYTTYTFFTTIFVGDDANICSRSEVYTNYVGPEKLLPTKSSSLIVGSSKQQFDFRNCRQVKRDLNLPKDVSIDANENVKEMIIKNDDNIPSKPTPVEVDMLFSVESNPLESENSYVTDVKSSFSKGEKKYVENNNVLDDQISSESNIEEIVPSPTLLLQTSYTTFTYFTTIYIGKDSSKVNSRLETITNVVTETITPKKEPVVEAKILPITYYTTFTYWTTLYKDKSTTITSREEIVSNVVFPSALPTPSEPAPEVNPIDTTPIDIESVLPPKDLEVELKPSLVEDILEKDDGKATFYTTYTYFTTFYAGNSSQIRSSLETVTNIVDNTKLLIDDNQIGRKVPAGAPGNDLIQDKDEKIAISPTILKEIIKPTPLPDISVGPSVLVGTYIDNLYAEVKPLNVSQSPEKKNILFSQVAVISGDSTIVTNDNKTISIEKSNKSLSVNAEKSATSPIPEVIESSVAETEATTEYKEDNEEEDDDESGGRKKSRLSFTAKKPSFTPVIRPFASRNRPSFSPKRIQPLSGATTITRSDFTPTITASPTLKTVRPSGFGFNRKQQVTPGSSSVGRRFNARGSVANNPSNVPSPSRSAVFGRANIQPSAKRQGYRSSSLKANGLDISRSAVPRIRPTATVRLRGGRQSSAVVIQSRPDDSQVNESESIATQEEDHVTENVEETSEIPIRTTNNPLLRFRRPPITRVPGTSLTPKTTTQSSPRRNLVTRGRVTTTTRRSTTRTTNPLLSLRRQRPNALFPKRNLFKQPEPEPEEEIQENEQEVRPGESEEILDGEGFDEDNDYDSSDRKEQHVTTPAAPVSKKSANTVQIRPFSFKRRTKRQVDYGNRKYSNFRRPGSRVVSSRKSDPEPEVEEPTTQKQRPSARYSSRITGNTRTTTSASAPRTTARQLFIIRGESRATTSSSPSSYRSRNSRPLSRSTTISSRPKSPRLVSYNSQTERSRGSSRTTSRSRGRGTTRAGSNRQRVYNDNNSGENYNHILDDGKITITHHLPTEISIPVVHGKITEYKNILTAKPSIQILLANQVSTSLGPLGKQQLVLASEATEITENGATKIIKFILHETLTSTVIFTPTVIRGRKTSYSHIVPSTIYNVEPIVSTITPELNANVPLANLLLSQLLLGNQQQPAINPLLALQGQGLIQPQPIVQTPITEYKVKTSTYVTTITDNREKVLPITFKGKAILTTIKDPTVMVITATEFITETIITSPTPVVPQNAQINSLLLPLLLQQQHQQQQALSLQTPSPLIGLGQPDLNLVQSNNLINNDILNNIQKSNILDIISNEEVSEEIEDFDEDLPPPPPAHSRFNKRKLSKPAPPKLSSVVTLYVSGRIPGEFSTVLSTIISDDTQTVRKREAIYFNDVRLLPSLLPSVEELAGSQADDILANSVLSETEKYLEDQSVESQMETQSLESIVGELGRHIRYDASPTFVVKLANPTAILDQDESSIVDVS